MFFFSLLQFLKYFLLHQDLLNDMYISYHFNLIYSIIEFFIQLNLSFKLKVCNYQFILKMSSVLNILSQILLSLCLIFWDLYFEAVMYFNYILVYSFIFDFVLSMDALIILKWIFFCYDLFQNIFLKNLYNQRIVSHLLEGAFNF